MKKSSLTILLCIFIFTQESMATDKKEWLLLSRSDGCTSLGELYLEYQYLSQKKTPQEIFIEIKKRHKKTTIRPFMDYIKEEQMNGETMDSNEKIFFKPFNKKNAQIIESKENNIEIILVTELLCENIFKK